MLEPVEQRRIDRVSMPAEAMKSDNGIGRVLSLSAASRPSKRLYTLPEAAAYLGRSTWSVRRLIWNGDLPSVRAGGRVHVDVRDMDEFIDKHKVTEG